MADIGDILVYIYVLIVPTWTMFRIIIFFFFDSSQVNRPLTMKKEGIQTRKRKPKNPINVLQANALLKGDVKGKCCAAPLAIAPLAGQSRILRVCNHVGRFFYARKNFGSNFYLRRNCATIRDLQYRKEIMSQK